MADGKLVRKVKEYRDRLKSILKRHPDLAFKLLSNPTIRDDFLFVIGALRIQVPLEALLGDRASAPEYA